jgi:hypothetical protein
LDECVLCVSLCGANTRATARSARRGTMLPLAAAAAAAVAHPLARPLTAGLAPDPAVDGLPAAAANVTSANESGLQERAARNGTAADEPPASPPRPSAPLTLTLDAQGRPRPTTSTSTADLAWQFAMASAPRAAGSGGCAAACHGRFPSTVIYDDARKAGLGDLHSVLTHVYVLAKSVCARPVWNEPWQVLTPEHNRGMELERSWTWDRYFRLPDDPPPARRGEDAPSAVRIETAREAGASMQAHYDVARWHASAEARRNATSEARRRRSAPEEASKEGSEEGSEEGNPCKTLGAACCTAFNGHAFCVRDLVCADGACSLQRGAGGWPEDSSNAPNATGNVSTCGALLDPCCTNAQGQYFCVGDLVCAKSTNGGHETYQVCVPDGHHLVSGDLPRAQGPSGWPDAKESRAAAKAAARRAAAEQAAELGASAVERAEAKAEAAAEAKAKAKAKAKAAAKAKARGKEAARAAAQAAARAAAKAEAAARGSAKAAAKAEARAAAMAAAEARAVDEAMAEAAAVAEAEAEAEAAAEAEAKAEAAEAEAAAPFAWTIRADMHQWGGALDVHRIDGFLPTDCLPASAFGPSPRVTDTAELVKGKLGVGGASLVRVRV